ncbi:hypothetical protein PMAYCL1PPCAC_16132 [Pristionchus mayeri]|uniref:Secreted protein n=1 Tax=Pristionchus mayeri TaxID=1317129 RepID=A0AAN5CK84_9BILA|nr:hypothetical protein PMAYCL1PPCAC_16132 [Pristionchus mayeri]
MIFAGDLFRFHPNVLCKFLLLAVLLLYMCASDTGETGAETGDTRSDSTSESADSSLYSVSRIACSSMEGRRDEAASR